MPTGYTAGIIDGTTKTFKDFAKECMRAFGACLHMRDEASNKPYKPMIPSNYHLKELEEANQKLKDFKKLSNKDIVKNKEKTLLKDKISCLKRIKETEKSIERLNHFLLKANKYTPPSKNHEGVKVFMIEQLEKTIEFDGNTKYQKELLSEIEIKLKSISAAVIRFETIEEINKDIAYHLNGYKEELERCAGNNKWVEDFEKSL